MSLYWIAKKLKEQTSQLIDLFSARVASLKGRNDIPANIIKPIDEEGGMDAVRSVIGLGTYEMVGIDGSMDYDERVEMLLFYIAATAFKCPIEVSDRGLEVNIKKSERDLGLSISSAIPLWREDISEIIEPSYTGFSLEVSIQKVPHSVMTMAELTLALNSLKSDKAKVILLDRPIAGTFAPMARDVRILLKTKKSRLIGLNTSKGPITNLDLSLGYMIGPGSIHIPSRMPYLAYLAIKELIKEERMSKKELAEKLNLNDKELNDVIKELNKIDEKNENGLLSDFDTNYIAIKPEVKFYWEKVKEVTLSYSKKMLLSHEYPFIRDDGEWISILDVSALNLFLIYILKEEAKKNSVLVIGITKDTAASEMTRSIVPYFVSCKMIEHDEKLPALKNDKAFLTIMSAVNHLYMPVPWRSIAYDYAFTTLIQEENELRPARRSVFREMLFIKSYFQTKSFTTDQATRSHVFAYDRFFDPDYDDKAVKTFPIKLGSKTVSLKFFFELDKRSLIDDATVTILAKSDNPEVLEALGHNHLLYLADKAVKAEVKLMRGTLRGVADLELGTLARKERFFSIIRRYRDLRQEVEYTRQRIAQQEASI